MSAWYAAGRGSEKGWTQFATDASRSEVVFKSREANCVPVARSAGETESGTKVVDGLTFVQVGAPDEGDVCDLTL